MNDNEIARRLALITEIYTPEQRYRNQVRAKSDSVVVLSNKPGSKERVIPFEHIRKGGRTPHSRIIKSFRQILGL